MATGTTSSFRERITDNGQLLLYSSLVQEAERVAWRSEEEQEAWLEHLRIELASRPNLNHLIESMRKFMKAHRKTGAARVAEAHAGEHLEADAYAKVEGLLDGSLSLPDSDAEQVRVMAQLAILGHLFPNLRQRFAEEDAQEYLSGFLKECYSRPPSDEEAG